MYDILSMLMHCYVMAWSHWQWIDWHVTRSLPI